LLKIRRNFLSICKKYTQNDYLLLDATALPPAPRLREVDPQSLPNSPACRATYHYRFPRPRQAPLRTRIREIAETRMRYGYRRITVLLRREGWHL
jgi:hypothetical protein